MVEFGLKLEDNKVAEWSVHYLDYNKLKAILSKAKATQKKYEEQAQKRPDDAKKILEAHRSGKQEQVTVTPNQSSLSLATSAAVETAAVATLGKDPILSKLHPTLLEEPSERTSLLSDASNREKSESSTSTPKTGSKISSFRAITEIQEYFGSRYERNMRALLQGSDALSEEFSVIIEQEQKKVTKFYFEKLAELENRLSMLIDNVATSSVFKRARAHSKGDEEETSKEKNAANGPDCTQGQETQGNIVV